MGSYTPNKKLYKADPIADAKDTFNITTMLNDNWDKLDVDTPSFDALAQTQDQTIGKPTGDTGTLTVTLADGSTRQTVISASTITETTTIGTRVVRRIRDVSTGEITVEVVNE